MADLFYAKGTHRWAQAGNSRQLRREHAAPMGSIMLGYQSPRSKSVRHVPWPASRPQQRRALSQPLDDTPKRRTTGASQATSRANKITNSPIALTVTGAPTKCALTPAISAPTGMSPRSSA